MRSLLAVMFTCCLTAMLPAASPYYEASYPPSTEAGQLQFGVTYTLWLPEGVKTIRGIIVHQHGCGSGACQGGATAAYDLHWQALARKWDCALMGPSYQQEDKQNCRLWCDPRNGSDVAFRRALDELATKSGHPEIASVPWCLWGHSGGGFWASLMQTMHPERIIAIWFRSGTAYSAWEKGEIDKPMIPASAYGIPMMLNPGVKERDDMRFKGAWTGAMAMFEAYRPKSALIGFAPDPRTAHECGDSRYLAIPFFDACLSLRLPEKVGDPLKAIDPKSGWRAALLGDVAVPAKEYHGKGESIWLPNEAVAKAWMAYVKTGAVPDTTPPPAPFAVTTIPIDKTLELTWDAHADLESGLQGFIIERDGEVLAQWPEKPIGRFGRPLFQTMSYHDTPEKGTPLMKFVDRNPKVGATYCVIAINSAGVKSAPSKGVVVEMGR